MKFFFDTADIIYLKDLWPKVQDYIKNDDVAGITTNPNAFSKINAKPMITLPRVWIRVRVSSY